ncbi:hypothetical protein [Ralstonia sp. 1B3]|uniref:hypothetical protein n=1 Tax=Ralstonia sp. 1B3 TaxID=2997421 RepID=UPI002FC624A4
MIGIEPKLKQPRAFCYGKIKEALDSGLLAIVQMRPRPFALRDLDAIPARYVEMRDRLWSIIAPLVDEQYIPDIFDDEARGRIISLRARQLGIAAKSVRRPLYRYWAHGNSKAALIPFYDLCGPQGTRQERKQKAGSAKRGRRPDRLLSTDDASLLGVAVADVRERIVAGITQFYKGYIAHEGVARHQNEVLQCRLRSTRQYLCTNRTRSSSSAIVSAVQPRY